MHPSPAEQVPTLIIMILWNFCWISVYSYIIIIKIPQICNIFQDVNGFESVILPEFCYKLHKKRSFVAL